jgi:hypothetical protein
MTENVQGSQAPVDAVEAQVFGQPVLVFVGALVERYDVLDMLVDMQDIIGGAAFAGA